MKFNDLIQVSVPVKVESTINSSAPPFLNPLPYCSCMSLCFEEVTEG